MNNSLKKLSEQYKHKLVDASQLKKNIGERPRKKTVIMCHGVFDVVHPGHLRHLLYAKSKADILVASLTADAHIKKGIYRPHVPEEMRALNLAAFEIVDYVLIDQEPTPLKNISDLEPDFYAKGYEYVEEGMPAKTEEEAEIIEKYGGKIIFTPGDIVYSSSALIELETPAINVEKLLALMEQEDVGFNDLRTILKKLDNFTIHIVGDTIVDSYTQTAMVGGQTKTPTMSVLYEGKKDYVGGAGIVAKHLVAAGAKVVFSTVLGDDDLKDFVLNDLRENEVDCHALIDPTRPTTNKNAIVSSGYRLLKIDTLDNNSIDDSILKGLTDKIKNTKSDAVIFSDFRHGIFNRRTIEPLVDSIDKKCFKAADSQVASRWGNITEFKDFNLITPNEREARFALADQDSGVKPLAQDLYDAAGCKLLILKLGSRGVLTCRSKEHGLDDVFVVDSFVENLVDAVGAGDALLAYSTLTMLASDSAAISTIIGSIAAACLCEKDGNIPITPAQVLDKIDNIEKHANFG